MNVSLTKLSHSISANGHVKYNESANCVVGTQYRFWNIYVFISFATNIIQQMRVICIPSNWVSLDFAQSYNFFIATKTAMQEARIKCLVELNVPSVNS